MTAPGFCLDSDGGGGSVLDLGIKDYVECYTLQKELVRRKVAGEDQVDYLILVEHPDTYTMGRNQKETVPGIPFLFSVERGGKVTFHNPGQLVGYPVLSLRREDRDLTKFLRRIEEVLVKTLAAFGIMGESRQGETGVWLQGRKRKIASIGVAVSCWVTYHGFALNVNNDLTGFGRINPCGYGADVMTSIKNELGPNGPDLSTVKDVLIIEFNRVFQRTFVL